MVAIGEAAPGLKLSDTNGNAVDLADYKGKKVLTIHASICCLANIDAV